MEKLNKEEVNTYAKYCPNVFVAKCPNKHERNEIITLTTRHNKEHDCIVFNEVLQRDGFYYYSIIRADGFNSQEHARKRALRVRSWAASAERKSGEYYEKSKKDSNFLSLFEPIKVGHHSERRHRKIIEQAQNNASKSLDYQEKAESYSNKINYWENQSEKIDLSIPESIEYFENLVQERRKIHYEYKSGKREKEHSYSLAYAKKALNEAEKQLKIAIKLWG